ncbi:hypothetical protein B0J13DRAFT_17524 [Dactylonectria estremocensis]|uniref:Secreted protein n=1 Tax=Dactylonectria estremocensis TaxID=1079267 RepID=A0A9P9FJN9_9HYPO|nr:hypothetical protein B0J13DRAFT_17524 [Dactylonectria estremocensis]
MHTASLGSAGNCLLLWLLTAVFRTSSCPTTPPIVLRYPALGSAYSNAPKRRGLLLSKLRPVRNPSHQTRYSFAKKSFSFSSSLDPIGGDSSPADPTVSRLIHAPRSPAGPRCAEYAVAPSATGYIPVVFRADAFTSS